MFHISCFLFHVSYFTFHDSLDANYDVHAQLGEGLVRIGPYSRGVAMIWGQYYEGGQNYEREGYAEKIGTKKVINHK